jgi:pre-rRNA-processing protein IPI1
MGKKTKGVNNRQSGGIDFIRAKKKVGKKIKKQANVTDTTVRAKRINLPGQTVGTEGKGEALTNRGLSMSELLNQTSHYSEKVRKDALEGMRELLEAHPETMKGSAAAVVEKTAERLVDREQIVRVAARAALKHGVLPALGKRGTAPFAKRLVLHVGAALTHVDPVTRRDAPAALETLLDFAPELVAAHAPAATLRHLADLLRRGDDAASSALDASASASATAAAAAASARRRAERYGLSPTFGDMTASRVGAAKPGARLKVLTACRRFLETLVAVSDASEGFGARGGGESRTATRFLPRFKRARDDDDERFDGAEESDAEKGKSLLSAATHAFRLARPPVDAATAALDAFGGGRASRAAAAERDDGAAGVPAAAADLAALLFSAWDEATPALRDASGGGADAQHVDFLVKTRCMTEALVCTRLALRLVDRADASKRGGIAGAAAGAAAGAVAKRVLDGGAFPAAAPAAHGAPERRALVAYNAAAAALLSATADGVAAVLDARREARAVFSGDAATAATEGDEDDASMRSEDSEDSEESEDVVDARAADAASASVAEYLAGRAPWRRAGRGGVRRSRAHRRGRLRRTPARRANERFYARRRFRPRARPRRGARARRARRAGGRGGRGLVARGGCGPARAQSRVRVAPRRRAPERVRPAGRFRRKDGPSAPSSARSGGLAESAAAKWLRPFARALWELKHRDPATTTKMLVALRTVASRATETQAPATHEALVAVESELAPFFALAPPPSADPDAPRAQAKLGPFARLPARAQNEAVALLGCLPALSPATVRAVAHAALAPRSATEPLLRKEKERHLHEREGRREDEELLDDVATRAVDAVAANVAGGAFGALHFFFRRRVNGRAGVGPRRARRGRGRARARRPRRRRRVGGRGARVGRRRHGAAARAREFRAKSARRRGARSVRRAAPGGGRRRGVFARDRPDGKRR